MRKTEEKPRAADSKENKVLALYRRTGVQLHPMAPKQIPEKIMFRPTQDDFSLVTKLGKRLGLGYTQIIRLALRRLAEVEGLELKAG